MSRYYSLFVLLLWIAPLTGDIQSQTTPPNCDPFRVLPGRPGEMVNIGGVGDINHDGYADYVVGSIIVSSYGPTYVYSGFDGTVLLAIPVSCETASGAGDVDNDGYPDLIFGRGGLNNDPIQTAEVYSGRDGSLIHIFDAAVLGAYKLGYTVDGVGDINDDGFDDVIVGHPADSPERGSVYVFSGRDGEILHYLLGEPEERLGYSVAGLGDMNNDNVPDFIVGALALGQSDGHGRAYVISGLDGDTIYTVTTYIGWVGFSVADAGDVNRDGIGDFIVGEFGYMSGGTGGATVYSGRDGNQLYHFVSGGTLDAFGWAVSGAGDVNGDGFADLIVGDYYSDLGASNGGAVYIYSGKDGHLLYRLYSSEHSWRMGFCVSGLGDINGDGLADVIVGVDEAEHVVGAYVFLPGQNDCLPAKCCEGRVGDADGVGGDEPTIGDISTLIDHLFLSGAPLWCYEEADMNQSGGGNPYREDITIGDISILIDYLFITGPSLGLPNCL